MEKILLAVNPAKINPNTIDFACYLANLTNSRLTAVFLEGMVEDKIGMPGSEERPLNGPVYFTEEEQYPRRFREMCKKNGVACDIHHDKRIPIDEIIAESRFADLLVIDAEMSFLQHHEGLLTRFVKEALKKSECPVVIAPYNFYGIDEIVFAYDGTASSMYSLKQFTYLFPQMFDKKVTILEVDGHENIPHIDNLRIREFLQMHYGGVDFHFLKGNASDLLFNYLVSKKNVFVVMRVSGRIMFSNFFKRSTTELLIKTANVPIFIAHH